MSTEEYPELDWMSPNEKKRFIEQKEREKLIARQKAVRQSYSNFTRNRGKQFSEQKEDYKIRHSGKKSEEELRPIKEQYEELERRIKQSYENIGKAMQDATLNEENMRKRREEEIERNKQRKKEEFVRYQEALVEVRQNDPRLKKQEVAFRIKEANKTANKREERKIAKYTAINLERLAKEEEDNRRYKEDVKNKIHPVLNVEDYAHTYMHAGVGIIPVTHETEQFAEQLKEQAEADKKQRKEFYLSKRRRTEQAAQIHQLEKNLEQLNHELELVAQYETQESLTAIANGTSMVHNQYNVAEKRAKRQQYIKNCFLASDDAPKPRGPAPVPEPFMPTTPNASDEE